MKPRFDFWYDEICNKLISNYAYDMNFFSFPVKIESRNLFLEVQ